MKEVVIVSAVRTPIGSFGGKLKDVSAVELGTIVAKAAIERAHISPNLIEEVIFGNVLQAGQGQNVARQVSVGAGIPFESSALTINKVCGSGLKTVVLAAQSIMVGDADIVLAGGTENMSQTPYVDTSLRWGKRMGDATVVDIMVKDGLWDVFNNYHMGITAENVAEKYGLTREEQDLFAVTSQNRAEKAILSGKFKDEIVPVEVRQRKETVLVDTDEHPRLGATIDALTKLKPAFKKDGSVTAGNASGINDGAAALILMSKEKAEELKLTPLCTLVSYASAGVDPAIMGTGPIPAVRKALQKANLSIDDIDLCEANEAFASQALSVVKELKMKTDRVNVNGGAIALGHPIGASGARILVSLIHEMQKQKSQYGLATLCIGGGQGIAAIVKK